MPEELVEAVRLLAQLAETRGACVAGFLWSPEPPFMLKFGNVQELKDTPALMELFLRLCEMYEGKEARPVG